jgi:hypothetical protein
MRKLSLKLDALQVETFEVTRAAGAENGTVRGHDISYAATECCYTGSGCTIVGCSGDCPSNGCPSAASCPGGGMGCPPAMDGPTV